MYTYTIGEGVNYPLFLFTSDKDITFNVRFEQFSYTLGDTDYIRSISVGCNDVDNPPYDSRVGKTVCAIIEEYLSSNNEEILSYVCDNLDKKGSVRQRKFRMWHSNHGNGNFIAVPHTIIPNGSPEDTIHTCLIFDSSFHDESNLIKAYENEIQSLEASKL